MNDYGKEMIGKGFPKVLVERAFEFSNNALHEGLNSLVGEDLEVWKMMQKAMMAAYMEGAKHMAEILMAKNKRSSE